jgi:hypothetical protein
MSVRRILVVLERLGVVADTRKVTTAYGNQYHGRKDPNRGSATVPSYHVLTPHVSNTKTVAFVAKELKLTLTSLPHSSPGSLSLSVTFEDFAVYTIYDFRNIRRLLGFVLYG